VNHKLEHARTELAYLRAKYDSGAVAPGIYAVIKKLEADISWLEHTTKEKRK
jgi:hypothetical protein